MRTSTERIAAAAAVAWAARAAWRKLRERRLDGAVALITGGSRGLGLLLAHEFARHGCRLVICARDERQLEQARYRLERSGADVLALPCDVSDPVEVEELVARSIARFGRIDILVNNAGIIQVGPLHSMRLADFEEAMRINFWGAVHTTRAVLPGMQERGDGSIVNITSIGGKVAVPHLLPYDSAKFALVGFSEGLHAEVARFGIRVTTIVPGLMRTGSPVNALFKGRSTAEFSWFSIASATPVTAMSAARAARRIVAACRRGEAHVTLTWQASLLRIANGVFPGTVQAIMAVANRLLPDAPPQQGAAARGMLLASDVAPSRLTTLMNRAARRTNQYAGRPRPSPRHAKQAGVH